ncbi:MAG TPA: hypothetical protein VNI57_01480 [Candidatus Saccharimonadales bacterium]|nr:hypothetical protein [Candidatus Saccharimonadales bacterium]
MADAGLMPASGLSTPDHLLLRCEEVKRLIEANMEFAKTVIGIIPLGVPEEHLQFPALMIAPESLDPEMDTTDRYHLEGVLTAYAWHVGADPQVLIASATRTQALLLKVLSNNALGDRANANATGKWKVNPTILGGVSENAAWYDSSVRFVIPRPARFPRGNGQDYIVPVIMTFRFKAYTVM